MIFPLVTKKLEKRRKVRLKFINKGYRKLKKENKLSTLAELKDVLTKTKLNNINLFSESKFSMELSIRQYLTENFLSLSFNESILYRKLVKKQKLINNSNFKFQNNKRKVLLNGIQIS